MNVHLIIAGSVLAVVTIASIAWRKYRVDLIRKKIAEKHGWTIVPHGSAEWSRRLSNMVLMQMGHSRRMTAIYRADNNLFFIPYVFETGPDHRRGTHTWQLVVCEIEQDVGHALISRQSWLHAATMTNITHRITLSEENGSGRTASSLIAVIEDAQTWHALPQDTLREWANRQPESRNWEIMPGLLVGYEPGPFRAETLTALSEAAQELHRAINASQSS